jgi:undecaprenyl diphosphate synthase
MLEVQEYTINELVEKTELKHIAIIMDGNRRWAKTLGLPTAAGHKKGVESLKKIVRLANDFGIKYITVYAFSTENWKRTQEEVSFLMKLLYETLKNELNEMLKEGVKIKIIGDMEPLMTNSKGFLMLQWKKVKTIQV